MDIWLSISKLKYFSPPYLVTIIIISVTTQNTISFWMIHCTDVVSIPSFDGALHMKRLNKTWMTATLEHVAVISVGWLQPRKFFTLGVYGLLSLKIVMKRLRNVHPFNTFIQKSAPTLLLYTPSLQLALFPNVVLILCIITLPQPGGMVTSLYPSITLQNQLRKCLHMQRMEILTPLFM